VKVDVFRLTERWAGPDGPLSHVVVSSRVRHARNLDRVAFPPHAAKDDLRRVCESVDRLIRGDSTLGGFARIDLNAFSGLERTFLKESHIISPELEQAGEFRVLYVDPARSCAIMVNEEDHLRMYCLRAGFQIVPVLESINAIDAVFGQSLHYAFSEKYGFLTTCPSNVGTGMRASVMLHLPGLVMTHQIEELLKNMPKAGLAVRGYYGENSEFLGDFYQVSNEVTLGKTEDEIVQSLQAVIQHLISREEAARNILFEKKRWYADDIIWRSYALLTHARIMASSEAFKLLSPVRLGIERGYFPTLTHHQLNQMIVAVQPAHLQVAEGREIGVEERDIARAQLLRKIFSSLETHK
jgi:protein arginine kinase